MATKARYIIKWLETVNPEELVGIDDGGLRLETGYGAYYEVGGMPEKEEDENK